MHKICAVTGSFDPVTLGHVDLVARAGKLFDKVFVLMLINPDKKYTFSVEERLNFLNKAFEGFPNTEVCYYEGYTADFCKERGIDCLVRGIRNADDLNYELTLADANFEYGMIETLFLAAKSELNELSSHKVRDFLRDGKDINGLVPTDVLTQIEEKKNG